MQSAEGVVTKGEETTIEEEKKGSAARTAFQLHTGQGKEQGTNGATKRARERM